MLKAFEKCIVSIEEEPFSCRLVNTLLVLCKMVSSPPNTPTLNWNTLKYYIILYWSLQIEPAIIECIPQLYINNNVKDVEATNSVKLIEHLVPSHKLATSVSVHKIFVTTTEPSLQCV